MTSKIIQVQDFLNESKCTPAEVVMIIQQLARTQHDRIQRLLKRALKKIEKAGFIDKGWTIEEQFGEGWLRIQLLQPVFGTVGKTVLSFSVLDEVPDYSFRFTSSAKRHTFKELQKEYPIFKALCQAMANWIDFGLSTRIEYPTSFGSTVQSLLRIS